jgi:hypothetical protein
LEEEEEEEEFFVFNDIEKLGMCTLVRPSSFPSCLSSI